MIEQEGFAASGQLTLFAAGRDEPRRRRIADVWLLGTAALLSLAAALIASGSVIDEERITEAFGAMLGWLQPLWSIFYNGASLMVIALFVLTLFKRRFALARDIVVASVAIVVIGEVLGKAITDDAPGFSHILWGWGAPQYPEMRLALVTATVLVAMPDLTQPFRRLSRYVLALVAVAALVLGGSYPSYLLGGAALGMVAGAVVRLIFGSVAGYPTIGRVRAALGELGVTADDLRLNEDSPAGAARYDATGSSGRMLVTVYGRDARDTQLLSRVWRGLWFTHSGPHASVTRSELVEHEALLLYSAASVGVAVPTVVAAGMASSGDAVLAVEEPPWSPLADLAPDSFTDAVLDEVWQVAARLREHRLGHGALNVGAFRRPDSGGPLGLVEWSRAQLSAPAEVLAIDTAELLVSCAMVCGVDRTVRAAQQGLGRDELSAALAYVQQAALTADLRDAVNDADFDIKELRASVAEQVDTELPKIAELRRVTWRDLILMALIVVAAYLLLSQLADVGIDTIIDELSQAQGSWVVFGFLVLQLTLVAQAYSSIAAVGHPLPFGPTTLLQSAIKFIGLTVPSAAGRVGLTTRFLTRQGVPTAVALTQGAIDSLAGFTVQLLILLTILPFLDLNLNLDDIDVGPMIKLGVVILIVGAIVAVVVLIVPALRRHVQPYISAAWSNVKSLFESPKRLVKILGGNCADQLCFAIAMGASVRAVGAEASIGELLVVNTFASLLSGLVPVPGGIGTSEFAIASGLTAVGVPPDKAFAATIIYRLLSFYIPPIPGYLSLRWLSKKGYV